MQLTPSFLLQLARTRDLCCFISRVALDLYRRWTLLRDAQPRYNALRQRKDQLVLPGSESPRQQIYITDMSEAWVCLPMIHRPKEKLHYNIAEGLYA